MKIIDLLNKIANGEEVPKKIKYRNDVYILTDNFCYYCAETNLILSDNLYAEKSRLNDTVEILEEEKKIPEKLPTWFSLEMSHNNEDNIEYANANFENMYEKINEICDYLKSKGE